MIMRGEKIKCFHFVFIQKQIKLQFTIGLANFNEKIAMIRDLNDDNTLSGILKLMFPHTLNLKSFN